MHRHSTATALLVMAACSGQSTDTSGTLPEDSGTLSRDTGNGFVPLDTGQPLFDEVPQHTLTLRQWGSATLAPPGGPYTSLSGQLWVAEYPDGDVPDFDADSDTDTDTGEPLACELTYQLAGVPSERTCDGCDMVMSVQFSLLSGDPSACHDPALPESGAAWTLAHQSAESLWLRDVGDSGTWQPWYRAQLDGDVLHLLWTTTVGVSIDEEM